MKYGLDASKEFCDFLRERFVGNSFYIVVSFGLQLVNAAINSEFSPGVMYAMACLSIDLSVC